jgi:hypothetical protein
MRRYAARVRNAYFAGFGEQGDQVARLGLI